MESSSVEKDAG